MPVAERDPIDPPVEPIAAPADDLSDIAVVRAIISSHEREIATLRAKLAEREARDAENWQPLKLACFNLKMKYRKARDWAAAAIKDGRSTEAIKIGGKVVVNETALRLFRDLKPG
jgi:hypothetical protein